MGSPISSYGPTTPRRRSTRQSHSSCSSVAGLASQDAIATAFSVNGSDAILRLVIDHPDDVWMAEVLDGDGALYKAESTGDYSYRGDDESAYDEVFDQEAGTDNTDLTPLIEFLDFINNADDATFAAELGDHLDVDSFATYLAMQELIGNFDDIDGPGTTRTSTGTPRPGCSRWSLGPQPCLRRHGRDGWHGRQSGEWSRRRPMASSRPPADGEFTPPADGEFTAARRRGPGCRRPRTLEHPGPALPRRRGLRGEVPGRARRRSEPSSTTAAWPPTCGAVGRDRRGQWPGRQHHAGQRGGRRGGILLVSRSRWRPLTALAALNELTANSQERVAR